MSYRNWFQNYAKKHKKIVEKLLSQNYTKDEIIDYFKWENLKEKERDFCPLFEKEQKCHDIEDLNCYLCACPNFRFDDGQKRVKSYCDINSANGKQSEFNGITHQDCSGCIIPHKQKYIEKHFDTDWLKIMKECDEGV